MKLLVTENRPEDRVGKIDFEHPGKHGKRGKMELLVTETSSRNGVVKPQHGKAGKARGLVSRSSIFPHFPRFPGCSEFTFEPCSSSPVSVIGPPQHRPGNPGNPGNGGSDLPGMVAGVRRPRIFLGSS